MQPLKDLSKSVMFVRKRAGQFFIDPNKVVICGFSAGGHLCGTLAVHYDAQELVPGNEYERISNRPDAVILSYPVISSGEYAHRDSFINLLGTDAKTEEFEYMSLEKHVTRNTPPVFLWHTATDELVPVENSFLFAKACKKQGVTFEQHVFGNGKHGLSLANVDWASRNYNGDYTMQQLYETLQYLKDNHMELPPPFNTMEEIPDRSSVIAAVNQRLKQLEPQLQPDDGIALWPVMANNWLRKVLNW
jgi:acetyl esterase/lipase